MIENKKEMLISKENNKFKVGIESETKRSFETEEDLKEYLNTFESLEEYELNVADNLFALVVNTLNQKNSP